MLDYFEITGSTTRDELIGRINSLDEEVQQLETRNEDQRSELEDLRMAPAAQERLAEAADLMADLGHIHNTPAAKSQWVNGN